MEYLKGISIIFGITMVGEFLYVLLPLPVPAGVYGLFILLILLCTGRVKEADVSGVGDLLLELMPLMFIPAAAGLIDSMEEARSILVPFVTISVVSTLFVMIVTGKVAQRLIRGSGRKEKRDE